MGMFDNLIINTDKLPVTDEEKNSLVKIQIGRQKILIVT